LNDPTDNEEKQSHMKALGERTELMVNMIGAASGGYSRRHFVASSTTPGEGQDEEAAPAALDTIHRPMLCVTPQHVVQFLKTLINADVEQKCADLGAGTGSLSGALPAGSLCCEIDESRCQEGKLNRPDMKWVNMDALNPRFFRDKFGEFDLVISNPDFEVGLQFIYLGLCLIKNMCLSDRHESQTLSKQKSSGRLIFLLPSDYFEASNLRSRIFKLLDFRIETEYKLGHLCYYTNVPSSQKLTCDSLFILRPGRGPAKYEHRVVNARLAGML
jgi:hypothetical protein